MRTIAKSQIHFDEAQHDFESLIRTAREETPIDKLRSSLTLAEAVHADLTDYYFDFKRRLGTDPEKGSREAEVILKLDVAIAQTGAAIEALEEASFPAMGQKRRGLRGIE